MRRGTRLAACLLLIAACTSSTVPTTDGFRTSAPSIANESSTTLTRPSTSSTTTPIASLLAKRTRGVLPDGTIFDIYAEPAFDESVIEISAWIMVDLDPQGTAALPVRFVPTHDAAGPRLSGDVYHLQAGSYSVEIEVTDELSRQVGTDLRPLIEDGVVATTVSEWPVLVLGEGLRWPTTDPVELRVLYETVSVRNGCTDTSLACSSVNPVQIVQGVGGETDRAWRIETPVRFRTPADPRFLDPGPVEPRRSHDLLWTGHEMVVWGGANSDRQSHLVDGAAFAPPESRWRSLPPSPLSPEQMTRAVWVKEEMVVLAEEGVVAYGPGPDTWRVISNEPMIPPDTGMTVVSEDLAYAWTTSGIIELDTNTGTREELPDPGFGGPSTWQGALRVLDGVLYAVGLDDGPCAGRLISSWTGTEWRRLPKPTGSTSDARDCALPGQSATVGGRLIVWEDEEKSTLAFDPLTGAWSEIARIPVPRSEGEIAPVPMENGFLVAGFSGSAIYDASEDVWLPVSLEQPSEPDEVVWTGDELLMWGGACCSDASGRWVFQDAWRWTPSDS